MGTLPSAGVRVRRMVHYQHDEVDALGNGIEFFHEPLALRPGIDIEVTVEHEHLGVCSTQRIITALLEIGETLEIIAQRNLLVALHVVVPQRWINGNMLLAPNSSFLI